MSGADHIGRTELTVPDDAALVGTELFFQALVLDADGDGGGTLTNATALTIASARP